MLCFVCVGLTVVFAISSCIVCIDNHNCHSVCVEPQTAQENAAVPTTENCDDKAEESKCCNSSTHIQ